MRYNTIQYDTTRYDTIRCDTIIKDLTLTLILSLTITLTLTLTLTLTVLKSHVFAFLLWTPCLYYEDRVGTINTMAGGHHNFGPIQSLKNLGLEIRRDTIRYDAMRCDAMIKDLTLTLTLSLTVLKSHVFVFFYYGHHACTMKTGLHCISPSPYSPISVFAYFVFAYS